MKNTILMLCCLCCAGYFSPVFSEEISNPEKDKPEEFSITEDKLEKIQDEMNWLMTDTEVTIATKHETKLSKVPGIVTVVTAEEIKHLGYRTFVEILRTVPGFEILKVGNYGNTDAAVRGVDRGIGVRVMLNGHLVNNPFAGGAFGNFDDFPVENIKRIEIIRGPGSALYGENAFLAVINIITFDAADIDGIRVSSGYGSFERYEENIVFGKKYGKVDISGMLHYHQTEGFNGIVESDSQTLMDNAFSHFGFPKASEAPGRVDDWRQEYDLNLKIEYEALFFHGWYSNKDRGPFIGPSYAVTDGTKLQSNYVFGEVGYKKTFGEGLTFKPRIYYDQFDEDYRLKIFPENVTLPSDTDADGIFDAMEMHADGLKAHVTISEKIVGTEMPLDFILFDGNVLTVGMEYRLINQTNASYAANFNPVTMVGFDSLLDFSESYPFVEETTRRIWSGYLQDTWDVTDTINLTLGVRYDQYSDFGNTTNPRAGITWAFLENASLKILYGEAFRAPAFVQMFSGNNPSALGNKDLKPETISTYEIGVSYQFNKHIISSMNYFYNHIEDRIMPYTSTSNPNISLFDNVGNARVQGIETETKIDMSNGNYLFMNYTFQDTDGSGVSELPSVARHKGNFGVNVHYWKYVNTNLSTFVSGTRSREKGDKRDDLPAFALLNLSVIGKEFFNTMEIQGTVFNLLDKDYSDPGPVSIEDDLPRPGRTFFVGLSYQF